jgi:RNA polymerase sigma factor (sigma-70 family)
VASFVRVALGPDLNGPTDAELLARFARTRDEGAFELLVWRHVGMVLRVCRAVLLDHHAAEDVTQATFLALAKQAQSVGRRGTVAGWLYRVARRISARLAARRRFPIVPTHALEHIPTPVSAAEEWSDPALIQSLHEELAQLPDKYRVPLLLCFFEGLTHADAARRLGWPIGTVATRVARGRDRLHRRLVSRGVGLPAAGLAALCAADTGSAVTPALVGCTVQAASAFALGATVSGVSDTVLALSKGAIQAMTVKKIQWATAVGVLCAAVTFGGGWAIGQRPGYGPDNSAGKGPPKAGATEQNADAGTDRKADSSQRMRSLNNLKQILLAIHQYNDVHGYLPADIRDKDGKPLLSWRVVILPYLEQEQLFKQFKVDEPWDSEHNLKLLAKMPAVYRVGFEAKDSGHTYYQAFAGPGTPLHPYAGKYANLDPNYGVTPGASGPPGSGGSAPGGAISGKGGASLPGAPSGPGGGVSPALGPGGDGGERVRIFDILDGTSNTLGVVEAGPPVPWSKPADLPFDPQKPLPKLTGPFANELHVAMMDGSAHALRRNLDAKMLRALIIMNDGTPTPSLKEIRAATPADTPEEKARLQKQMDENQQVIEEMGRLMAEYQDLLALQNSLTNDLGQSEDQQERLRQIVNQLKAKNKQIRDDIGLKEGLPVPKARR